MRQQSFVVFAIWLVALLGTAVLGTARGQIVNGSFEDSPGFNGWTIVSDDPEVRPFFQHRIEVIEKFVDKPDVITIIDHDFLPVDGERFAFLEAQERAFMSPFTEEYSTFEQVFSAGKGDVLAFEYFAFGKTHDPPPLPPDSPITPIATSSAIVELTNLSWNESVKLVDEGPPAMVDDERPVGLKLFYDAGSEWVSVSHTITEAADYRLTIGVSVTVDSPGPFPADAEARLGIDNVRLITLASRGDLFVDGFIDSDDLFVLLGNWASLGGPTRGDLFEDEDPAKAGINSDDLFVLLANWTGPGASPPAGDLLAATAVPEPSGLLLAAISLPVLLMRRRRRHLLDVADVAR